MSEEKGSKKRYIAAASAVAAVLVAVLAVVLVFGGREETYRSIRIVELAGGVTIDREGVGSLDASENMNLISGDQVRTAADSYVVLRLDEDKYVMLGEQGSMQVEADGNAASGRTAIRLEAGSVLNEIQNPLGEGASYEIVTPNATMSVRGTVFETRRNTEDANIELLVYEGTVAVGLDGLEPVLYGAGEYMQFTDGDDPQFLVERDIITEERINSQMIQRLQQIDANGRSLDLGEAQLEELIAQQEAAAVGMAENNNLPVTQMPENTPAPEATYPVAVDPTSSPGSAVTGRPVTTAPPTEAPESSEDSAALTPAPGWNPSPIPTPEPSVDSESATMPGHSAAPAPPTASPESTKQPEETSAPTEKPTASPDGSSYVDWRTAENDPKYEIQSDGKWRVIYYLPEIATIKTTEDDQLVAEVGNTAPTGFYQQEWNIATEQWAPKEAPPIPNVPAGGKNLTFVGWFTESGEEWNPEEDVPSRHMCVYAVWKEDGEDGKLYKPEIWRDEIKGYRCYSVREDVGKDKCQFIN